MQSIDRSISPINQSHQSINQPIASARAHIQSIDHQSSNQCIDPVNQSVTLSNRSIILQHHSHSLNPSIHYCLRASSCPRYSDLHRGLSPRLSTSNPSGSPSIHQSARSTTEIAPINHHHSHSLTHSLNGALID
jgi:hypothetical protein